MFNRNQESILNKTTILFRDQLFSRKPASSNVFLIVEHSNMIENVTFVIVVSIFLREASFFIFYFIFTCTVPALSLTTIQSKLKNIISLNQRIKKNSCNYLTFPVTLWLLQESKKNCPSQDSYYNFIQFVCFCTHILIYHVISPPH